MRVPLGLIAMLAAAVLGAVAAVAALVLGGVLGQNRTVERTVEVSVPAGEADARIAAIASTAPAVVRVLPARDVPGGSAVVVLGDGTAVTALRVVGEADRVRVAAGGRTIRAEVAGRAPALGLAVLRTAAGFGEPARMGGLDDPLPVGLPVMVVANATGLGTQATSGIVAGVRRETTTPPDLLPEDTVLTDAAQGRQALGGALIDERGRIIGVVVRVGQPGGALPMDLAAEAARTLIEGRPVAVPYLGVAARDAAGDPPAGASGGAVVTSVRPGSPAAGALEPGDTVVAVGPRGIDDPAELADAVGSARAGEVVDLAVVRDGERADVSLRLGTRPSAETADR